MQVKTIAVRIGHIVDRHFAFQDWIAAEFAKDHPNILIRTRMLQNGEFMKYCDMKQKEWSNPC